MTTTTDATRVTPTCQPPVHVLVLCHADSWIEVFAPQHVRPRIALMPHADSAAGRIAAEEYVDATLPLAYRELYYPSGCRAAELLRTVRPSDIARRDYDMVSLRSIEKACAILQGDNREGRTTWML